MSPDPELGSGIPFSALSPDQKKQFSASLSHVGFPAGAVIYVQEISRIEMVLILSKGSLEFYYQQGETRTHQGKISPPEIWGGLSLIYNDQISIHTLVAREDSQMACLPSDLFLEFCRKNKAFSDYFALELGRCMTHNSFADVLARRRLDKKLNLPFFNQPVSAIFRPNILTCPQDTPVLDAAKKMSRQNASAILVKSDNKEILGIVTDADLKHRVVARDQSHGLAVSQIVSTPLVTIPADAQVFDAFLTMIDQDKRHLAVTGKSGDISGIITEKDLIAAQTRSTFLLIKAVKSAKNMNELDNIHSRLEQMLLDPISNGANADYITRLITTFSDAIIHKIMEFSIAKSGPPPCRFVFLTMGSEGREEQTLISDQDNAIVFEDLSPKEAARAKIYFDDLSKVICGKLDRAGYRFCQGNNMAQNPDWCQPLSAWKTYFAKWIRGASPEDLLYSSIFFDFRGTWGDTELADELKGYLLADIGKWSGFLRNLAENAVCFKPPISFFGKFVVESQGTNKDSFDIKMAMLPIIDFARIFALKNGISQTNTLVRLFRLYTRHALTAREYTDIIQSYNFLMGLRFRRQITTIMDEKAKPDNYINPKNLSSLDQIMLKEIFKLVENLQQKLTIEFTGVV